MATPLIDPEPLEPCERCGERPGTVLWLNVLAVCRVCWGELIDISEHAKKRSGSTTGPEVGPESG